MKQLSRKIAAGLVLIGASVFTEAQQLRKLPPAQLSSAASQADAKMLPAGATGMKVDRSQIVSLSGPSALTIVPVRFSRSSGQASAPFYQCGLFFVSPAGTRFVLSFGADWTETESCDSLKAIGTAAARGAQPVLALIYQASGVRESFPEPVLLTWDETKKIYSPDEKLSRWITDQQISYTIPNIRQALAKRSSQPPGS